MSHLNVKQQDKGFNTTKNRKEDDISIEMVHSKRKLMRHSTFLNPEQLLQKQTGWLNDIPPPKLTHQKSNPVKAAPPPVDKPGSGGQTNA